MSELIKENKSEYMIDMTRLRLFIPLGVILLSALLLLSVQPVPQQTTAISRFTLSQGDEIRPNIYAWGVKGTPELGLGFDVWANVTDDDSGLRNVTVQVSGPNMNLNSLMTFNGTYYNSSVPAFPNDGLFDVNIRAYDLANNSRISYYLHFQYEENPVIPIDPTISMPFVVGGSFGLIVLVIVFAIVYDRKKSLSEQIIQPENGSD
jgi:hypothetical protein